MRKVDTVLFDFDGTVMDTVELIIKSWQHTFLTLDGRERPLSDIRPTLGEPLEVTIGNFFPNHPASEALKVYRNYHHDKFDDLIRIFPGITDLLADLKKDGYTLALVTSRLRNSTDRGLRIYGLESYFESIITYDDTEKHKPDPAPIEITLERLNKKPENAIMIGDTDADVLCAKNAGVKSVLVGWAMTMNEDDFKEKISPDFIINEPSEVKRILENLNKY